jgi:hypothetical protein
VLKSQRLVGETPAHHDEEENRVTRDLCRHVGSVPTGRHRWVMSSHIPQSKFFCDQMKIRMLPDTSLVGRRSKVRGTSIAGLLFQQLEHLLNERSGDGGFHCDERPTHASRAGIGREVEER